MFIVPVDAENRRLGTSIELPGTISHPPPTTPSLLSVEAPADGQAKPNWSSSLNTPITYDIQYSSSSSFTFPTTTSVSASLNTKLFTGLSAGTYFFRVRGVNTYGNGGWSNTTSVAVSSSTIPETNKIAHGVGGPKAFLEWGYTQGPVMRKTTTANGGKFTGPIQWSRSSAGYTSPGSLPGFINGAIDFEWLVWGNAQQYLRNQNIGPRLVVSIPMCFGTDLKHNAKGSNAKPSYIAMCELASGTMDSLFTQMFNNIKNSTGGGQPAGYWVDKTLVMLGNEHNANWYAWFSGTSPELIGDSDLASATAGSYPDGVHLLMHQAAIDGDRGPVFLAGVRRIKALRDAVNSNIPLGITYATPASGTGGTTAWSNTMKPDPSEAIWDTITLNLYNRGSARPTFLGGDSSEYSSWNMSNYTSPIEDGIALAAEYNRPFGMVEWGGTYNNPDMSPTYTLAPNDDQMYITTKWLFERMETVDISFLGFFCIQSTTETKGATYRINFNSTVEALYPKYIGLLHDYFGFI